jgi:dTDP-4-amino-4,6-dideoxygalactose transaminase
MPNLNAAVACAQLEQLSKILDNKRALTSAYEGYFADKNIQLVTEISEAKANNWLNTLILNNLEERDAFLKATNESNIMTRPIWKLMNKLSMYANCQAGSLENAQWLEDRVVNIPSSYRS